MPEYSVKLKIADIVVRMHSAFKLLPLGAKNGKPQHSERFKNFFYQGRKQPEIEIKVELVKKLPQLSQAKNIFVAYHFRALSENWRLLKKDNLYIYQSTAYGQQQLMLVNPAFDRVVAYLLPKSQKNSLMPEWGEIIKEHQGFVWSVLDIIYDFLQVLLINYFAQRNSGVFTHSVGVKEPGGEGLLFSGKSGSGKSTLAKLWHKNSKAMVLNDDRIVIRKAGSQFFIHGSPWHGAFSDYLDSKIESAPLKRLCFIQHAPANRLSPVSPKQAFRLFYPCLFPVFWDKVNMQNTVSFCQDLLARVPCYNFGFVNDKRAICFLRRHLEGRR